MRRGQALCIGLLAACLCLVLLVGHSAEAKWYCNGISLEPAATYDSGWIIVVHEIVPGFSYEIGRRRVSKEGAYAWATVEAWSGKDPGGTPIGGEINTGLIQMNLAQLEIEFRRDFPGERPGTRPTEWSQKTDCDGRYYYWLDRLGTTPGPDWSAHWESTAFAADNWWSYGLSHTWTDGDDITMPPKSGSMHAVGQWTSLPVAEHCAAYVQPRASIEFTLGTGKVQVNTQVWADSWGAECSGCP